ncbi:MAG: response regulator transcription factor [Sphingobacteriia bacterium]|nr:response regulator transcription factor [Sphingobacteriia bacterium]
MKKLRIVIVEDEAVTARNLAFMLTEMDAGIGIVTTLGSVSEATLWLSENDSAYDLIFMDIRLTDGLSFEIFNKVPINKAVIFVTAYHDYAIEAFKNNGIDYILKPFDESEIRRALQKYFQLINPDLTETGYLKYARLMEQLNAHLRAYKKSFLINYRNKLIPLDVAKIAWFYTAHEIVYAYTNEGGKYTIEFTLEQLEKQLDPAIFFRVNRQFIISRSAISEIEYFFNGRLLVSVTPASPENILISKARAPLFKNWLDN